MNRRIKGECPFTPSVHTFYAFEEALDELLEEGVQGRLNRYRKASTYLREEFKRLDLELLLPEELPFQYNHGVVSAKKHDLCQPA